MSTTLHTWRRLSLALPALVLSGAALAGGVSSAVLNATGRNIQQDKRIEQGLRSGGLSTAEAARLQREQAQLDHLEARSLQDGHLSLAERQRIAARQHQVSQDIRVAKTNGVRGDPHSAASRRMQAQVQRQVHQQVRAEEGLRSGRLTPHEAARLAHVQPRADTRPGPAHQGHPHHRHHHHHHHLPG